MVRVVVALLGLALSAAACSGTDGPSRSAPLPTGTPSATVTPGPTETAPPPADPPDPSPSASTVLPPADPDSVRVATAMAAVRHLAGEIGPRPGTSPAYFRAADWVEGRLTRLGWEVRRQRFRTPGGVSWGIPVAGGTSVNLIATRGDVRSGRPWLLVGAHLDTVPQAPGAEDNASGVGVVLAVAEAVAAHRTRLPVILVAFGSEEPRGPTDDDHHYGSRAYVASLTEDQRRTLRGMVSLDRVGVGSVVPVGSPAEPNALTVEVRRAAFWAGVPTTIDWFQRSSDHWSFARDGLPGVRLGGTSYAGYHSPADVPSVVDRAQLERAARVVVAWLR
jgi:aminopeptidase YwaD